MQKMPNPMSSKLRTDVHAILICYSFNRPSNLIDISSRSTDGNSLIQGLLRHLYHSFLDLMLWLPVENGKIVVSVIAVDVRCDVDVDLITQI